MNVIEFAEKRLQEEIHQNDLGADNGHLLAYWSAYLDGARAQLPKLGEWVGVSPTVDTVQCSVCGGQLFSAELETPYCPYCGAKMEVQE